MGLDGFFQKKQNTGLINLEIFKSTSEGKLNFLNNIQRLLREGDFSATYKFALLRALADLCVENEPRKDGSLTISIKNISEKYVNYYWPQVVPFVSVNSSYDPSILQQNSSGQAKIVSLIKDYKEKNGK